MGTSKLRRVRLCVPLPELRRNESSPGLSAPGTRVIPVGTAIALDSTTLPELDAHKDPADRVIVATARRYGTLLTCDQVLLEWGRRNGHVRLVDGRP